MRFIRKNGRVIPINDRDHNKLKAAGLGAAGLGVATAAGKYAGRLMEESAQNENMARTVSKFGQGELAGGHFKDAKRTLKIATVGMLKSRQLHKASFRVRDAGGLLGSALIGAAVYKGLGETRLKDDEIKKAAITTIATPAAHFAIRSSYLRGTGMRGAKVLKQAFRRAFLKV